MALRYICPTMRKKQQISIPACIDCKVRGANKLFCDLTTSELDQFSDDRSDHFFRKGETIFNEGDKEYGLYCIHKGKVKVYKFGDEGKEQIVRLAGQGDVLGYRSLLSNEPFNASAKALEDSVICRIRKSKFLDVLENNPAMAHKTIQLLTQDLKDAEQKLVNITQKPVVERVAEALLILKEKFGLKADGKTLDVVLTRREIGNLVDIATETTIRALADLNKTSAINLNGKFIEITDVHELANLADILD